MLYLWILISLVAILIDILTSSFLFFSFAIGGIAALLSYTLNASVMVQIGLFLILSIISILWAAPFVKRVLTKTPPAFKTMEQNYIGKIVTAQEDIKDKSQIKYQGIYWYAVNHGEPIKRGTNL
ncbi:NfeD family protein [Caloramator sp. E03]|uniref:NfeD family protein n=1 Tax=Caloramator sp. E03 TaxID=2576307 RepID=UPI00110FF8D3|nr:NfeD family protein [Caloramator sp. E03]QCX33352.1 NfeD family protein [Caloramator sp. E03]